MSYPLGNGGLGAQASWGQGFARSAAEAMYPQLRPGLIAAYHPPLGPTGLNLHDATGRSDKGILTTMDPATDWIVSGQMGWVLDFDGDTSNGGVFVAGFVFLPTFTLSAWVNADTLDDDYRAIVARGAVFDNNTNYAMSLRLRNTGSTYRLVLYYRNGATLYGAEFQMVDNASPIGEWHHFLTSYDGTTIRAYQDGVQLGVAAAGGDDTPAAGPTDGSQSLSIGRPYSRDGGDSSLDAQIAGVDIWDHALVASQVQLLASRPDALVARPNDLAMQIAAMRGFVAPAGGIVVLRRRRECA